MSFDSRKLITLFVITLPAFMALAYSDSICGDEPSGLQTPKAAAAAGFDDHQIRLFKSLH